MSRGAGWDTAWCGRILKKKKKKKNNNNNDDNNNNNNSVVTCSRTAYVT